MNEEDSPKKGSYGTGFQSLSILTKVHTQHSTECQSLSREKTASMQWVQATMRFWSPSRVRRVSAWERHSMEGQSPSE